MRDGEGGDKRGGGRGGMRDGEGADKWGGRGGMRDGEGGDKWGGELCEWRVPRLKGVKGSV